MRHSPLFFGAFCILLTQCIGEEAADGPSGYTQVLESIASDVTLARYNEFAERSELMTEAASLFCNAPSEAGLDAVKDAWWDTREPWKRCEIVKFGPSEEGPRLRPKLDFWPVNGQVVEDTLEDNETFTQDDFSQFGGSSRGLPVVEYLLWAAGDKASSLEAFQDDPKRCAMLIGATADVAFNAATLRDVWRDEWVLVLSDPEAADAPSYATPQDVVDEWVNRMAFTVENIRLMKLGKPAGDKAEGLVQLDILESRPSGRSLDDARDALQGVKDVWEGAKQEDSAEDSPSYGVRTLVRNSVIAELVDDTLEEAATLLNGLEGSLEDILLDDPSLIQPAQNALLDLQKAIQSDLAPSMNTTIKFNDADGD